MSDRKKILITGANGLLGKELIELLSKEHEIHALVRAVPESKIADIKYHQIDFDLDWNVDLLPKEVNIIIHLSQSNDFREFPQKALNIFNVNIATTAKLLDYAQKTEVKQFILASSGGVYGDGGSAFSENASININNQLGYYLGSKLCTEVLAQNYSKYMDVLIMRFFFMYGKNQKRSMLIPRLVDNVKAGNPIQLQGDSGIKINPIHVSDAAQALKASLELSGSYTFNIAGDEVLSIGEIAEIISRKVDKKPNLEKVNASPKHLIADIELMKSKLHSPKIKFSTGVEELI